MVRLKSLNHRFAFFMLIPVTILLLSMGIAGFTYARNQLLTQWGEATILKLQRAAHHVDMRLNKPKEMINLFHRSAGMPHAAHVQNLILEQLKKLEWVTRVDLNWVGKKPRAVKHFGMNHHIQMHESPDQKTVPKEESMIMMPFHSGSIVDINPPKFDSPTGGETVTLTSELRDFENNVVGKLEVEIIFRFLIDTIEATGWWQEHKAFLVDKTGMILASNVDKARRRLADNGNPVERSTLYAMRSLPFGTIFGKGFPPKEISGFYKLEEAPWILVLIAPGSKILSLLIRFRIYFFAVGGIFILIILFLIRFITSRTVSSIKDVSQAAHRVAEGDYDVSLLAKTQDEVGNLIHSFNTMVKQLEERNYLKYSLNVAKEVQQNLLPEESMRFYSLDVAGQSIYCDETGGDYYDFLHFPELGKNQLGIAVGDVSGHGVGAALFMTTARAMIRSRMIQLGAPSSIITDVNRLLCMDTAQTGNFMTLFFLVFDEKRKEIRWVRAGHEPAIFYDAAKDKFAELGGKGIALGVDKNWSYKDYYRNSWGYGQLILIGTDGIWETENNQGERFGKERLRKLLRRNNHVSAAKIVRAVTDTLADFRQKAPQEDDVTLVVIKATS
jgi:sigma-B regulation protein RsbU (phosphoserine phosphatase)